MSEKNIGSSFDEWAEANDIDVSESKDRAIALMRAPLLVAQWQQWIDMARGKVTDDDASFWKDAIRNAPDEQRREELEEQLQDKAMHIAYDNIEDGQRLSDVP